MPAIPMAPGEAYACVSRVAAALQSHGMDLTCPTPAAIPAESLLEKVPSWIARYGSLIEGNSVWVYCEPRRDTDSDPSGQFLIRLQAGRYLVDSFDINLRTCVARESAAGDPLVIALVSIPRPLLLWIRPIKPVAANS